MNKKIIVVVGLCIVTMVYGICAYNSTYSVKENLNDGQLTWSGGVNDKYVYSELEDNKEDKQEWSGRVWVENSMFKSEYVETLTSVNNVKCKIAVSNRKTWLPLVVNKAGYKNIKPVDEAIKEKR